MAACSLEKYVVSHMSESVFCRITTQLDLVSKNPVRNIHCKQVCSLNLSTENVQPEGIP